jgi:replicative DNA helicase
MDLERTLISRALLDKDLLPLTEARVRPEWFEDADSRKAFEWILEYWKDYSTVPTSAALKSEYPTYRLIRSQDPLPWLVDEMRKRRRFGLLQDGLLEAVESLQDGDPDTSLRSITAAITQLMVETAGDIDTNLVETWESRMDAYRELRNLPGGLRGIPTGFRSIDFVLSGLQAQQLITLVGLPKSGKSTMVLRMAINAWMSGKVPLFVGFEMSNHEQEARFDAMVAGVDHQKLLTGRLTDEELDALEDVLRKRKSMEPFYLSSDITSSQTVSGLAGKVEQYKPDLLIVDGVYMMFDEVTGEQNTPQALTNITRSMKRLAQSQQIPIMQTTQALNWKVSKKKGLQSDAIGYSSSFLQDSDVVFGVESIEDVNDLKKVSVLDARSAPRMAVNIRWDWSTGTFTEEGEAEFGDDGGEEIRKYEEMGGN